MATITFTIPDEKITSLVEAIKGLYPIPQIPDPEWVDPDDGSEAPLINEFTDNKWAKEFIRRFMIKIHFRYQKQLEEQNSIIIEDDTLVS